jgi:hypothetical protein
VLVVDDEPTIAALDTLPCRLCSCLDGAAVPGDESIGGKLRSLREANAIETPAISRGQKRELRFCAGDIAVLAARDERFRKC